MRTVTMYRDDSTVQVVYENVKAVFWTANNTVLVVSQFTNMDTGAHRYIHWPRERICWFKDEPDAARNAAKEGRMDSYRLNRSELLYAKPPYSYEFIAARKDDKWRIKDSQDNAVGSAKDEESAQQAVRILNLG